MNLETFYWDTHPFENAALMVPSELPEDSTAPIYRGADVSLWFINAVHQYFAYTADSELLRRLLPTIDQILDRYRR